MSKTQQTTPAAPEFVTVDPSTLVLGDNVRLTTREEVEADTAFVASVRESGVLVPVSAYRDEEGRPVVIMGQRRTLAALITGQDVPVVLYPTKPENVEALRHQWDENERRAQMTEDDRVRGIEQMSLLGLTPEQIAQHTGEDASRVDAALSLVGTTHRTVIPEAGLTIEQAATLADFDDDPQVVAFLIEAAQSGDFEHAAARERWSRTCDRVRAETEKAQQDAGVSIIEGYHYDGKTVRLTRLQDAEGNALDLEAHAACPGHAVSIDVTRGPDGTAVATTTPWCVGWRKHGHTDPLAFSDTHSGTQSGPMSEEQKAERREVIANNKAWDAAVEPRRAWLVDLSTRKTPPPGAEALIASYITGTGTYRRDHTLAEVANLLQQPHLRKEVTSTRTTKARLTMIALLQVLASWEVEASRQTWRSPSEWDAQVMRHLVKWGYKPSDVEKILTARKNS